MKTILKILGALIGVVVLLIVVAAVVLPMFFDPNSFKDEITAQVREQTGRELKIPGEIGLSVFPWLGVDLGVVELSNAAGFEPPIFASTRKVNIRVKLMPLLSKQVEMDTVTVHGLTRNLARDKKGRNNWDDLAGGAKAEKETDGGAPPVAGLAIGGLDIRDAMLSWNDAQAGEQYTVRNVNIRTGALTPGKPVDLDIGLDLEGGKPKMTGHLAVTGKLNVDPDRKTYQVAGLQLDMDMSGEGLPGGKASLALGGDALFDGTANTLAVENLLLKVMDMSLSGGLKADQLDSKPRVSGSLKSNEFSPRNVMKALGQEEPETADPGVLSRASVNLTIGGNAGQVALKPFTLTLDQSSLTGDVSVSNFAKPAIRFNLALDEIDADRYLPPASKESAPKAATPGAGAASAAGLPSEALRALDVDGQFRAGKVKVSGLSITDIKARLLAKGGVINLSPVTANLYEGSYRGNIGIDARKAEPRISLDEKLEGVQAGPLLMDLQGADRLTGTANMNAKLTAVGATAEAAKRTLNGNAAFSFTNGAVKGVNIGKMIREAQAKLQGKSLSGDSESAQTDFSELTGSVNIRDGLATNNDLSAKSPLLRVTGEGQANIPQETIDYRVTATVVGTTKGQGGKELGDLAGVPIPVHVTGTFKEPKYGLDMAALGTALAKSKAMGMIEEQAGGATGGLGEKVEKLGGDKAKGLLKGLLGK